MIPRLNIGRGITGAVNYVMGPGRDPVTGFFRKAEPGQSRVEWIGGQGFAFDVRTKEDVDLARRRMEFAALHQKPGKGRPCIYDCVHLTLSWHQSQRPTHEQVDEAARKALEAIGMQNARAIFVAHNDEDYAHVHIVASKLNPATGRAYDLYGSQRKLSEWAEAYERENGGIIAARRVLANALRRAIAARDASAVLAAITQQRATFTVRQLERELFKEIPFDGAERSRFLEHIMAHPAVVALSDHKGGPVTRYTTQAVLERERYTIAALDAVSIRGTHYHIGEAALQAVLGAKRYEGITREQVRAVRHATAGNGLAVIDGQAGTGKSFVLSAIREAYERAGYRVTGIAPTNAVAQDMRKDGFAYGETVHSELYALIKNRRAWDRKTVVIADEAAMLDTNLVAMLSAWAAERGAKLIFTGDDRQLSSIDCGGMFAVMKQRHGCAELREVKRQKRTDERRAAEMMAEGNFAKALDIYDQKGAITWVRTQHEARELLVRQWAEDCALAPEKRRFVFAYTNNDVDQLNSMMRRVRQARHELGEDHWFDTDHGEFAFARGDRIQFTGNDKPKGIYNGYAGTIKAIKGTAITVALDNRRGECITFDTDEFGSFRHGYVGTIYKGQGKTLDQSYLYHSEHWKSASSYVALTRHREKTALFVARNTARDLNELARQMARSDETRAASMFHHGLTFEPLRPLTAREAAVKFGGGMFELGAKPAPRKSAVALKAKTRPYAGPGRWVSQENQPTGFAAAANAKSAVFEVPAPGPTEPPRPPEAPGNLPEAEYTRRATDQKIIDAADPDKVSDAKQYLDVAGKPGCHSLAVRDTARGSKNRPTLGGTIKALFRAAGKAVALRSHDAPKPDAKKRRGGRGSRSPAVCRQPQRVGKHAAKGRFDALRHADEDDRKAYEMLDGFAAAAGILCKELAIIVPALIVLNPEVGKGPICACECWA